MKCATFSRAIVLSALVGSSSAWGALIGPAALPIWEPDAQVQVGWDFQNDPTNPQLASFETGWDQWVTSLPELNYVANRIVYGNPAQWYFKIYNVGPTTGSKHLWISYVFEREAGTTGPRTFSSIEWTPATGYDDFSLNSEWFNGSLQPTTNHLDAVYERITIQVDLFPNPQYEEIWLGVTGGPPFPSDGRFDLLEAYILTQHVPEPVTLALMALGLTCIGVIRRQEAVFKKKKRARLDLFR